MKKDLKKAPVGHAPRASADYAKASPEEIMADIERTRAHMDETLHQLGRKLKPTVPRKVLIGAAGVIGAGILALVGWTLFGPKPHGVDALRAKARGFAKEAKKDAKKGASRWHEARTIEQAVLAGKLAMAARKGKPAIIVVEPRKI